MPLWLIPIAPLFGAVIAGILALTRKCEKAAPCFTLLGTIVSGAVIGSIYFDRATPWDARQISFTWLSITDKLNVSLGVRVDSLTWVMLAVVVIVSALVQLYSTAYMKGENGYSRYFAYLSLFTASMIGLVVADNLFQLYVCWELVGICSYLLVGFWWHKPSAAMAAKKAFVVTRFGDVGFMLGVLFLSASAGSFDYSQVEHYVRNLAHGASVSLPPLVSADTFLWLAPLLLFCGAVGKSAQFPLHVWLPDAMEGPTPVSALIHAATMVAAGVYMVARLLGLFAASTLALNVVLIVGAITALMAATIALVQYDIKKVLAYSTVSQLGYMMMGLGAGGVSGKVAGMFHLTTHAFFKALLFLAAGSVIHALHHAEDPNDLRRMGGLAKRMPVTAWTCLIGVLALAGFPLLSGFWSKDSILHVLFERAGLGHGGYIAEMGASKEAALFGAVVGVLVAGITAFYAVRMWVLAFSSKARSDAADHAHESPWAMTLPLVILAVPSISIGWFLHHHERFAVTLVGRSHLQARPESWELMIGVSVVALAGMAWAWKLYRQETTRERDPVLSLPGSRVFENFWGMECFWNAVGARGSLLIGRFIALFDRKVIDGAVNGFGALFMRMGVELRRSTNGQAQSYAIAVMVAALLVAGFLVWMETVSGPTQQIALNTLTGGAR